ncbi:MAG TPA: PKD domain-containing protein, partial [Thermoanaerobaculia bacterium]|nr:PKD domain-containing protein [Thermoanaerobaculia bacterium]
PSMYSVIKKYRVDNRISLAQSAGHTLNGIFLDDLTWVFSTLQNYRRPLWAYSNLPLSFSYSSRKVTLFNGFSMGEFVSGLSGYVHSKSLILGGSMGPPWTSSWFAGGVDMIGGEVTDSVESLDRAYARRTFAYGKSWSNLFVTHGTGAASASQVLSFVQQALLLGYFPGFNGNYWDSSAAYERDRALFKQYIPLVQKEAAAGWQPVNYASSTDPNVQVERFGSPASGKFYISAQNTSTSSSASPQFTIDGAGLGIATTSTVGSQELVSGGLRSIGRSGTNLMLSESLAPGEAVLYEISVSGSSSAPVASFNFAPACQTCKNTIQFTDTSTNSPTSWSWSFGDGGTSTAQNPQHSFAASGTYNVSLTARNAAGSGGTTRSVVINLGTSAPVAAFTFAPACQTCKQSMQFTDTSTNSPTSWSWTFGDGGTSASRNPLHSYASAGTYTARLTATNASGSSSASHTVTISLGPVASFTVAPACQTCKNSMQFTDTSTNSPTSWSWAFGDGGTSTLRNPGHSFAFGTYTVRLTATNSSGSGTYSKSVVISP